MRVIVLGAGAIGGVVAACLAEAGTDVVAVARGDHARAIAASGLVVETPEGARTVHLPVVTDPRDIRFVDGDLVVLAVKSQDTAGALGALRVAAPPSTPIVCMQNGVANEPAALRMFANVYGVTVMCPTGHLVPGVVEAYSFPVTGILDLGRYPAGVDDTAASVVAALEAATFVSVARPDIMRWKYGKLLMNLGNAVEALCGPSARLGELAALVRDEGVACLRAAGVDFVDEAEDTARRGDLLSLRRVGGRRRGGGSTWQSLQRRTGSIETDHLNGEIVLLGRCHGVETPANALVQRLVAQHAADGAAPGVVAEDELLAMLAG